MPACSTRRRAQAISTFACKTTGQGNSSRRDGGDGPAAHAQDGRRVARLRVEPCKPIRHGEGRAVGKARARDQSRARESASALMSQSTARRQRPVRSMCTAMEAVVAPDVVQRLAPPEQILGQSEPRVQLQHRRSLLPVLSLILPSRRARVKRSLGAEAAAPARDPGPGAPGWGRGPNPRSPARGGRRPPLAGGTHSKRGTKTAVFVPLLLQKSFQKVLELLRAAGVRSLRRAFASIWRMRSRVTLNSRPTSSSVRARPVVQAEAARRAPSPRGG